MTICQMVHYARANELGPKKFLESPVEENIGAIFTSLGKLFKVKQAKEKKPKEKKTK